MDEMKGSEIATSTSCTRAQRTNQQAPKPQTLTEFCVKRTSSAKKLQTHLLETFCANEANHELPQ